MSALLEILNTLSGRLEVVILSAMSTGAENARDPGPDRKGTEWTLRYQALYMRSSVGIREEQKLKAGTVDVGAVVIS